MKKIHFPTEKMAVISTCHISRKDSERLDFVLEREYPGAPRIVKHKYGWLIFMSTELEYHKGHLAFFKEYIGFGRSFLRLYDQAFKNGLHVLDLDADGEQVNLRKFSW